MIAGIYATYEIYPRDWALEAMLEMSNLLQELAQEFPELRGADRRIIMRPGGFKGVILVDLRGMLDSLTDEREQALRRKIVSEFVRMREEGYIRRLRKLLLLDELVPTDLSEIRKAMVRLKNRIKGKWRITPKTRKVIDREALIKAAAEPIEFPVDLQNPEYVVFIQVMGEFTGIAVERVREGVSGG